MDSDSEPTSPSISSSFEMEIHDYSSNSLHCTAPKSIKEEEKGFGTEYIKFSIENILRPDFGRKTIKQEPVSPLRFEEPRRSHSSEGERSGKGGSPDWPAWVFCTRYSDRPSSGPRARRPKRRERKTEEKRPRTAFTQEQLDRLKKEFTENRYLTEKRRQDLAKELQLNESQIKIWFQNKRAKLKKSNGHRNPLQLSLIAQGIYQHISGKGQSGDEQYCD